MIELYASFLFMTTKHLKKYIMMFS